MTLPGLGRRRQLWELEDQPWLPRAIRDGVTDFLSFAATRLGVCRGILPQLRELLAATGATRIVDLCSGGGGPWPDLLPRLRAEGRALTVLLTDRFPNGLAGRTGCAGLESCPAPCDATAVPAGLTGPRTLFSCFHHFDDRAAAAILADTVARGQAILVVETTQRHPLLLAYMLLTPLLVLASVPWMRPWRWDRLFWTWVLPAIPLVVLHDGIMSCLRTRTPAELLRLAAGVPGAAGHRWRSGIAPLGRLPVGCVWLAGMPERPAHAGQDP